MDWVSAIFSTILAFLTVCIALGNYLSFGWQGAFESEIGTVFYIGYSILFSGLAIGFFVRIVKRWRRDRKTP